MKLEEWLEDLEEGPETIYDMTEQETRIMRRNLVYYFIVVGVLLVIGLFHLLPGILLGIISLIAAFLLISKKAIRDQVERENHEI